jgi:hypothetical protein
MELKQAWDHKVRRITKAAFAVEPSGEMIDAPQAFCY